MSFLLVYSACSLCQYVCEFLQVVQSVLVGYIAEYFSYEDPTSEQARDACLFCLGLLLSGCGVFFIHAHGFHMGYRTGMDVRVITTSAIYQKVHAVNFLL